MYETVSPVMLHRLSWSTAMKQPLTLQLDFMRPQYAQW